MNGGRHLEVFTEEASATIVLETLFARFLPETTSYRLIELSGIENFFDRLPNRLKAYSTQFPEEYHVVLLADRDNADCHERKSRLETIAQEAGLFTKTMPNSDGTYQLVSRLAIEELEAWFFGDMEAVRTAYPGVSSTLEYKEMFRDPDAIKGGTAEHLLRVLQEAGYYRGQKRLPKLEVAQSISTEMEPSRNRSRSFRIFWDTVSVL